MELPQDIVKKLKDDTFNVGERIGDWEFKGNTTKPGDPKWNEWVNIKTGQSTLTIHKPIETIRYGDCEHYYELLDNNGLVQCNKCEFGQRIVWGLQVVQNGKIYSIDKKANKLRIKAVQDSIDKHKSKKR